MHGVNFFRTWTLLAVVVATAAGQTGPGRTRFPNSIRAVDDLPAGAQPGTRPAIVRRVLRNEELAASVDFEIALSMRDFPGLQARIARGEVISPQEMARSYWPTSAVHDRVAAWFGSQGIAVVRTDGNHLAIFGRGSIAQVQQAFQTAFARVAYRGAEFTSAISAPSLPADIAVGVAGIHGLQQHVRYRPRFHVVPAAGASAGASYLPAQILNAYGASGLSLNGSGQTIGIISNAYPSSSDLNAYWTFASVGSTPTVQYVNINGGPASPADSNSQGEANLDVEWASSLAPGATIRVYGSNVNDTSGFDKTYQQVYADATSSTSPTLHQFSISFGLNESEQDADYNVIEAQFMANLASAGISVLAASGDGGSNPDPSTGAYNPSSPLDVSYPASDPDVTGVGGTTLQLATSGAISQETAWSVSGNQSGGTGGGPSAYFARPAWQTGAGIAAGNFRLTPDVASSADPNYGGYVIISGQKQTYGGTSLATPTWAAFCAMINQSRASAGQSAIGFLNPRLYPLIGTASFHDVTSGSNGAYSAAPGYDLCTGLGTPNVSAIIKASLATPGTAPVLIAQTLNRFTTLGQSATFAVAAAGAPTLSYQWQRQPSGVSGWSTLADGGNYRGTATSTMTVSGATATMSGDQFRCIVSNASGSATGSALLLTVASTGITTFAGFPGAPGSADGTGSAARFNGDGGLRMDSSGNIYVSDAENDTIRKITPSGVVTTVAGSPVVSGSTDGSVSVARLNAPGGVAVDSSGNLYVADSLNYTIRKITPAGLVSTLAGSAGLKGSTDGLGTAARFEDPENLAVDSSGNVWVADGVGNTVRMVSPSGQVTTIAGKANSTGSTDGTGTTARFNDVLGVALDASGNVWISDSGNNTIRRMTQTGTVTTIAGSAGRTGSTDGTGTGARFYGPGGLAVNPEGNVIVADSLNNTIREVTPSGVVTTIAGSAGLADDIDSNVGTSARFSTPADIAIDSSGIIYVADSYNETVRRLVFIPQITNSVSPIIQTETAGASVTLNAPAALGTNLSYQWQLNGASLVGATGATLTVSNFQSANSGVYSVSIINAFGSTTTTIASLNLQGATQTARLLNLSANAGVSGTQNVLSVGFSIGGTGSKQGLLRGIGPTLTQLGVSGAVSPLQLVLNNSSGGLVATDTGWSNAPVPSSPVYAGIASPATAALMASVGAFALPTGSADCAMAATLPTGTWTTTVSGLNGASGIALSEIYDADTGTPTSRLLNISSRSNTGGTNPTLTAGFSVGGTGTEKLLIRAVGPTLGTAYGITGALSQPILTLFDASGAVIASDTGWGNSPIAGPSKVQSIVQPATATVMAGVGAFALPAGSADSAMLIVLPAGTSTQAGTYTAQVTGAGGSAGNALVEIYEVYP